MLDAIWDLIRRLNLSNQSDHWNGFWRRFKLHHGFEGRSDELKMLRLQIEALSRRVDQLSDSQVRHDLVRPTYYFLGENRGLTYLSTGQPIFVNTHDCAITPWLLMGGHWETWADEIITSYMRPGMKVIDIGANVGYYSVKWGGVIGPTGELHAFEPNPEMTQFIHENFVLNGLSEHCTLHCCALGSTMGVEPLTFTNFNTGMATLKKTNAPPGVVRIIDVPVRVLDDVLPNIERVDFIKIDVEGYEPNVIAGARELLQRSPKCAFHVEVQSFWEDIGGIEATLAKITAGRCIFVLCHDKTIRPIALEDVAPYVKNRPGGLVDIFICPPEDEYLDRVRAYMQPF